MVGWEGKKLKILNPKITEKKIKVKQELYIKPVL